MSITLLSVVTLAAAPTVYGEPLVAFAGAERVETDYDDGDSFRVRFEEDGKQTEEVIRLYYVDAPETSTSSDSDLRRIREQARYFGLEDERRKLVINFGEKAREFVAAELKKPFTVYTSFARAQGRSKKPRIYAMVATAEGEDLAKLLVENGLARAMGVGRQLPNGTPATEYKEYLSDLEMAAAVKKAGIWAETNTEKIAELRKLQRDEDRELKEGLSFGVFSTVSEDNPLDLNTANAEDLQQLDGIGPELADRIVAGQPYENVTDILKVRGIGKVTLEKISRFLIVEKNDLKNGLSQQNLNDEN